MNFAHYAGPALAQVRPEDFEPALLWGAAMLVVLLITAMPSASQQPAGEAPVVEACHCTAYGA